MICTESWCYLIWTVILKWHIVIYFISVNPKPQEISNISIDRQWIVITSLKKKIKRAKINKQKWAVFKGNCKEMLGAIGILMNVLLVWCLKNNSTIDFLCVCNFSMIDRNKNSLLCTNPLSSNLNHCKFNLIKVATNWKLSFYLPVAQNLCSL